MSAPFSATASGSPLRSWFDPAPDARLEALAQMAAIRRELVSTLWESVLKTPAPEAPWSWAALSTSPTDMTPQEWLRDEQARLRAAEIQFCRKVRTQETLRIQAQDIYWRLGTQFAQSLLKTPTGRRGLRLLPGQESSSATSRLLKKIRAAWDPWAVLREAWRTGSREERFLPQAPQDLRMRWILEALNAQAPTRWALSGPLWTVLWSGPQGAEVAWRERRALSPASAPGRDSLAEVHADSVADSAKSAADSLADYAIVFPFWQHWIRGALHGIHPQIQWRVTEDFRSQLGLAATHDALRA